MVNIIKNFTEIDKQAYYVLIEKTNHGFFAVNRRGIKEYLDVIIDENSAYVVIDNDEIQYSFKEFFNKYHLVDNKGNLISQLKGYYKDLDIIIDINNVIHITKDTKENAIKLNHLNIKDL